MNGYEKRMKIPNEIIISFDRLFIKAKNRMPSCLSSLIYKNGVKRRMQMNMYAANGAVTSRKTNKFWTYSTYRHTHVIIHRQYMHISNIIHTAMQYIFIFIRGGAENFTKTPRISFF